jgi:hypothetical protein
VTRCILDALSDPDCPNVVALLMDVTRSTSLADRSPAQVRYVCRFLGSHASRIDGRCAFVVASDAEHSMVRLGAAYAASVGVEIQGFRNEAAARDWLGVDTAGRP